MKTATITLLSQKSRSTFGKLSREHCLAASYRHFCGAPVESVATELSMTVDDAHDAIKAGDEYVSQLRESANAPY